MQVTRKYLIVNSIFSAFSGLLFVVAETQLQFFFNITTNYIFPVLGANLLLFAAFAGYVAARKPLLVWAVRIISLLDFSWLAGSVFLLIFRPVVFSPGGQLVIASVAIIVGFLGFQQYKHARIK